MDGKSKGSLLLNGARAFIVQDSWHSVALYELEEIPPVHRFVVSNWVRIFAVSPNGKVLLVGCDDGSVSAWDVELQRQLWQQSKSQTELGYIHDICFSPTGDRCVLCGSTKHTLVLDTISGLHMAAISVPPDQAEIMSGALSPDGTTAFLIDRDGLVYIWERTTEQMRYYGIRGRWPIRSSADGRYVAFRMAEFGKPEQLTIVAINERLSLRTVGEFGAINSLTAAPTGSFLVEARIYEDGLKDSGWFGGYQIGPASGSLELMWNCSREAGVLDTTDFVLGSDVGVSTDSQLVTKITDLRNGYVVRLIDNSGSRYPLGFVGGISWLESACGAVALAGLVVTMAKVRAYFPKLNSIWDGLMAIGAIGGPFVVLWVYWLFVKIHSSNNDWMSFFIGMAVGILCVRDIRWIPVRVRLHAVFLYVLVMSPIVLTYALLTTHLLFTEWFILS